MLKTALCIALSLLLSIPFMASAQNTSPVPITAENAGQISQLAVWENAAYRTKNITFNADLSAFLTYSESNELLLWAVKDNVSPTLIHTTPAVAYALSQQHVAYQVREDDPIVHIWNLETGTERLMFDNAADRTQLAWNADATRLAYVTDEEIIEVWDIVQQERLIQYYLDGSTVASLAFSAATGDLMIQTHRNSGITIDTRSFEDSNRNLFLSTGIQRFESVVVSPDGSTLFITELFYVGGENGFIYLTHGWNPFYMGTFQGRRIGYLPDGSLVSSVAVGASHRQEIITIRDPNTLEVQKTFVFGGDVPTAAYWWAFSPNGARLVTVTWNYADEGGTNEIIKRIYTFWEVEPPKKIVTPEAIESFGIVAFSPDSTLLVTDNGHHLALWDTQTGALFTPPQAHVGQITRLIFSADGTRLLSLGDDGTIHVWGIPN